MKSRQVTDWSAQALSLQSERLGPLPLVNHFLKRLGLEALLERFVPTLDRRVRLPYAKALLVLLRSVLVEREPLYRQGETVHGFCPAAFGLKAGEAVSDDAIGQGLDRLFDADRAGLLTAVVVAATEAFDLRLSELHQDTTSISFCGQYREARGRAMRGRRAPFITYGWSKAHRPDLKQLLWVLTTTADGAVPVQFRCEDGNTSDSRTHAATWDTLLKATGRSDFLYVADSKLCSEAAMDHIDRRGGRFVCVLPRSRSEDSEFREWLQTHEPAWELLWDRPNRRRQGAPRDRWWVHRALLPSHEGWPVVWVKSSALELRRRQSRRERLLAATQALETLNARLAGPRPRRRSREQILQYLERVLRRYRVRRYLRVELVHELAHQFRQTRRGRPGPNTHYQRKSKQHWQLRFSIDEAAIAYDRKSDGMYPLLSNDRTLTDAQILEAHKRQPTIEKRFSQSKSVFEIAPVFLKNEGRIEALFYLYFLVLLVQALIERELRRAMQREQLSALPLYPEERATRRPTAEQILRLFSHTTRSVLRHKTQEIRRFDPELTDIQRQILTLLMVPLSAYRVAT
jgi:transposase